MFIVYDEHNIYTYIYIKYSIYGEFIFNLNLSNNIDCYCFVLGSSVQKVGQTSLVSKQIPLLMYAGEVMSATSGGQLTQLFLTSHDSPVGITDSDQTIELQSNFNKQLALHRYLSFK